MTRSAPIAAAAAAAVLLLAGCGRGPDVAGAATAQKTQGHVEVTITAEPASYECEPLAEAIRSIFDAYQLLYQIDSNERYRSLEDAGITPDAQRFSNAIKTAEVLRGAQVEQLLGPIDRNLDNLARAADLLDETLASSQPFGDDAGKELHGLLNKNFVSDQSNLSHYYDELCGSQD